MWVGGAGLRADSPHREKQLSHSWSTTGGAGHPLSIAINALVGLSSGGPVLVPALQTFAWVTALTLALAPLAVRRFRLG